jgi:hypothetical protein
VSVRYNGKKNVSGILGLSALCLPVTFGSFEKFHGGRYQFIAEEWGIDEFYKAAV